jgi:hypothetical protein
VRSRLSWRRRWRPRWTEEVRPSGTTRATDLRPLVCGTTPLPTRRWPTYRCPCRAGASNHQRRPGAGTDGAGSGRPLRCRRQGRRVAGATTTGARPLLRCLSTASCTATTPVSVPFTNDTLRGARPIRRPTARDLAVLSRDGTTPHSAPESPPSSEERRRPTRCTRSGPAEYGGRPYNRPWLPGVVAAGLSFSSPGSYAAPQLDVPLIAVPLVAPEAARGSDGSSDAVRVVDGRLELGRPERLCLA